MDRSETELQAFRYTIYVLLLLCSIALIYFIVITRRYILQQGKGQIDILTTATFLLLGLMLSSQIIQKAIATINNQFYNDDSLSMAVITLRMFQYASQNMALTINISRWALILKSYRKTNSINIQGQQVSKIFMWTWIIIFVSYSCVLCVLELTHVPVAADIRRYTQACLINPVFIVSYIVIDCRIKQILRAEGTQIFFAAIIQYLAAQSVLILVPSPSRIFDITDVLYKLSSIFLFFGVSLSIRKALDVERKYVSQDDSLFIETNTD